MSLTIWPSVKRRQTCSLIYSTNYLFFFLFEEELYTNIFEFKGGFKFNPCPNKENSRWLFGSLAVSSSQQNQNSANKNTLLRVTENKITAPRIYIHMSNLSPNPSFKLSSLFEFQLFCSSTVVKIQSLCWN